MKFVFMISILLKGIGAVLEVLLQIVITKQIGVTDYGTYSTFVNAADLIYWCLFSGIVKCNTFYLAESGTTIRTFKKKYYSMYVFPLSIGGIIISTVLRQYTAALIFMIALAELLVMDQSSSFMARKYSKRALLGEYVLGRFFLLIGIVVLFRISKPVILLLLFLYLLQFLLVEIFFLVQKIHMPRMDSERSVSIRKWANYQRADIIQAMIGQMPVVVQYLFVGSYEAGVVSIVMLVKKLVNFISGPSFKIFLPEFSRLYTLGDKDKIKESFASIIRMQMLFLAPMSVILIGFPKLLLKVLADDLVDYSGLFIICSVIFIVVASLGPCSGLMQMTGNEHWDNRFREIALACMFCIFFILRENTFFVLYGLCIQAIIENTGKMIFVSRWMGGLPMKLTQYLKLWLLPGIMIWLAYIFDLQQSFLAMFCMAGFTFICHFVNEVKNEHLLEIMKHKR